MEWIDPSGKNEKDKFICAEYIARLEAKETEKNKVDNKIFLQRCFQFMFDFGLLNDANVSFLVNSAKNVLNIYGNKTDGTGLLRKKTSDADKYDRYYTKPLLKYKDDEYFITSEISGDDRWSLLEWIYKNDDLKFSNDDIKEFKKVYDSSEEKIKGTTKVTKDVKKIKGTTKVAKKGG